jgi:hypothetical protein
MRNYFKDKKFKLLYLDIESGIPISWIPRLIVDDETNMSQVIAARAGPVSNEPYSGYDYKVDVRFHEGQSLIKTELRDIFDHFCTVTEMEWTKFLAVNPEKSDELITTLGYLDKTTVNRLLLLAVDDGKPTKDDSNYEWSCKKITVGGPELVLDFLLSVFCNHDNCEWVSRDDPSVKFQPVDDLSSLLWGENIPSLYMKVPIYDFSNFSGIDHLREYEEDYDDEFERYKSSNHYYYYSVNLKALSKLEGMIRIPPRVLKILTKEQKAELDAEIPKILKGELDYIAKSVLQQKVDSYEDDQASRYAQMREREWASSMYDALGGNGVDNVYMNDGLSLTPDGQMVDD